ncbi:hypothetical protein STVIR_1908 [Streptomyces viridochromogenes Tue57]|uniref:Uncharacterized protein n=1 Tax=Streptomyces viridochromogenes Tue57 TaxID=1160705 RepID=L8PM01_STRVR|nr:hypothetical protein STVIR_1908 [Streptomyces viridochromogenes Tue57]
MCPHAYALPSARAATGHGRKSNRSRPCCYRPPGVTLVWEMTDRLPRTATPSLVERAGVVTPTGVPLTRMASGRAVYWDLFGSAD